MRNRQQFRRVYDQGYRFHSPFFSAFILITDSGQQRYGITVTRKVGCAVVRNRCKRRLREILRNYEFRNFHPDGFDLVVNAKAELAEASFGQIQEVFSRAMEKFRHVDKPPAKPV